VKVGPLVCVLVPFLVGVVFGAYVVPHDGECAGALPQTNGAPAVVEPCVCPACPGAAEHEVVPLSEIQAVSVDASGGDHSQYEGQVVQVQGIVEAVHSNGFFIIDESDFGLYVYVDPHDAEHPWPTDDDGTALSERDRVELQGEILEYYGVTEMTRLDPDVSRVISHGNLLPEPVELGSNALSEEHEGVMVAVQGDCIYHDIGHGEWGILVSGTTDTVVLIDDMLDTDAGTIEYNRHYYVEGIGHFSFGEFKVEATVVQDLGDGALVGPEGEYVPPPPPVASPPPPPPTPSSGTGHATQPASPCAEVPTVLLSEIQAVSVDAMGNDHSPYEGQIVKIEALVLAVNANGFFIQDESDFGLWVYIDPNLGDSFGWPITTAGRPVESGDRVELQGEIMEYHGVTELTRVDVAHSHIVSHGNTLPMPFSLRTHELSEEHEGVLVSVQGVCTFHDIGHGEWVLNDGELDGSQGVIIDDMLDPEATPEYNRRYRVEGIGHFSYGQYKVEATSVTDLGPGHLDGPEGVYSAEPPAPPPCTPGSQSVAEGCVDCMPGFADTDADPFTPCESCPVGTYAGARATDCTDCSSTGMLDHDMDPSTACEESPVCIQSCAAGFEDLDCDSSTACTACPPNTWSEEGVAPCTACGKSCPPPPPPAPPPPPPPPTCERVMEELQPTHSRHDWRTLPALPCLEVPPCSGGRSVFAELEYIVQDGLDHPRGEGQLWPIPDDFNAEDAIEPTSAELCWIDGTAGQELRVTKLNLTLSIFCSAIAIIGPRQRDTENRVQVIPIHSAACLSFEHSNLTDLLCGYCEWSGTLGEFGRRRRVEHTDWLPRPRVGARLFRALPLVGLAGPPNLLGARYRPCRRIFRRLDS
jgi:hypothetical protein